MEIKLLRLSVYVGGIFVAIAKNNDTINPKRWLMSERIVCFGPMVPIPEFVDIYVKVMAQSR